MVETNQQANTQQSQQQQQAAQTAVEAKKDTSAENLAKIRTHYERELAKERQAREEIERKAKELEKRTRQQEPQQDDEDDDDEPYVDKRKLKKTLDRFGEQTKQHTQTEIQQAVQIALKEERKQNWLKSNSDFYDVMQHVEKFAQHDPELAETILEMPDSFERQKLVYKNIKAFGLHKPPVPQQSIQDKIDANKRAPYYQPSGVGAAPYNAGIGDFSKSGQKSAYDKMKELQARMRI